MYRNKFLLLRRETLNNLHCSMLVQSRNNQHCGIMYEIIMVKKNLNPLF
jgi:hypothetical protein